MADAASLADLDGGGDLEPVEGIPRLRLPDTDELAFANGQEPAVRAEAGRRPQPETSAAARPVATSQSLTLSSSSLRRGEPAAVGAEGDGCCALLWRRESSEGRVR